MAILMDLANLASPTISLIRVLSFANWFELKIHWRWSRTIIEECRCPSTVYSPLIVCPFIMTTKSSSMTKLKSRDPMSKCRTIHRWIGSVAQIHMSTCWNGAFKITKQLGISPHNLTFLNIDYLRRNWCPGDFVDFSKSVFKVHHVHIQYGSSRGTFF